MDYQKMAKVLLRVLGVWLIAQSLSGVVGGLAIAMHSPVTSLGSMLLTYPVVSGASVVVGIALYAASDWLARMIAQ